MNSGTIILSSLSVLAVLLMQGTASAEPVRSAPSKATPDTPVGSFYCDVQNLGTYFECTPPEPDPKPEEEQAPAAPPPAPEPQDPYYERETAAIEGALAVKEDLDRAWHLALMDPTPETWERYLTMQKAVLKRASVAADWQRRTVYSNPELDFSQHKPFNQMARNQYKVESFNDKQTQLRSMSERYGIVYIFASDCGACKVYSPLLRTFADRYGFHVMAVSKNGGPNPHFEDVIVDRGTLASMGLDEFPTPTTVVLDTETDEFTILGAGVLGIEQIGDRLIDIMTTAPGDDW